MIIAIAWALTVVAAGIAGYKCRKRIERIEDEAKAKEKQLEDAAASLKQKTARAAQTLRDAAGKVS